MVAKAILGGSHCRRGTHGDVAGLCTSSALIAISPCQGRERGRIAASGEGRTTSTSRCGHLGLRTTRGKIPHQATFRAPTALYQTDGPRSRRRASAGAAVRPPQPCVYPYLSRPEDPAEGPPPARNSNRAPRTLKSRPPRQTVRDNVVPHPDRK